MEGPDPLGSQVVSDDADIVKELDKTEYDSFMEPAGKMKAIVPDMIQAKCNEFVENFCCRDLDTLPEKLSHDNTWKESEEDLVKIADEILNTL